MMRSVNVLSSKFVKRSLQARSFALAVTYKTHGNAEDVYKLENVEVPSKLEPTEALIKMLAAPINPSDINLASGTYGKKPPLPCVGGNEGVGVVEKIGSAVTNLKVGDWVLPTENPFGSWIQYKKVNASTMIPISNEIPVEYAATLTVNPATALCLLKNFAQLKPGDVIIQNGANSVVGLSVIQIAREMGIKTVNIIRGDRPGGDNVLRLLENLGGTVNVSDSYLRTAEFKEIIADLPPIKLAFNCVGGEATTDMARVLSEGAQIITYGGMSKRPLTIPFDVLTEKQITMKGFWISDWYSQISYETRAKLFNELVDLVKQKKLSLFYETHDFDDFEHALKQSQEPFHFRKVVLNLDYPDRLKLHDAKKESEYQVFETYV